MVNGWLNSCMPGGVATAPGGQWHAKSIDATEKRITPEKLAVAAQEARTDLQIGQNPYAVPVKPEGLTTVRHLLED